MDLKKEFQKIYGSGEPALYYAPGRVNLIGEHIDYNGGKVFPCALSFGTYAAIRLRDDHKLQFASMNFPQRYSADLDHISYKKENGWSNYPQGVILEFLNRGVQMTGMDVLILGEIPNGSGLSSSASIEVVMAEALNDLFGAGFTKVSMVQMCQHSENTFNGVNCGIMDQFAVGMGRESKAILLDCASLDYQYVPLDLKGVKIVIGNTHKKRGLADSKYNERRGECDEALADLQKVVSITNLCDLTPEKFEEVKDAIQRPICKNRAEHAVYENARVLEAVRVLEKGDLEAFGQLMNESHDSLRDLYEVTGKELDTMVEEERKIPGTLGARMTGAGFGGCTVALVKEEAVDEFIAKVGKNYETRTGLKPEFYVAEAGQGMCRIDDPLPFVIDELLSYALDRGLIEKEDVYFCRNALMEITGVKVPCETAADGLPCEKAVLKARKEAPGLTPEPILKKILDYMVDHGMLEGEDVTYRDLMDAKIMGVLMGRPSEVAHRFFDLQKKDPVQASEYFYQISRSSHYVMDERIAKNLYWTSSTPYGDMEITINLSKPEKDPKVIAKLLTMKSSGYPKCLLCPENVGYAGRADHPARQNLRQIPMKLEGEQWYLQYSPYTYYQEHCILLKGEHVPMKINVTTFKRLFSFIETLPHYFMGSNAGLPVVGGSILNHEHYQGGHHVFPMETAKIRASYIDPDHKDISIGAIDWAMSGIRLAGKNRDEVIAVAEKILNAWESYSDPSVSIYAETEGTPHNAITPIARFNAKGEYELDLVLRNNLTTDEYPDGVFHPHKELHHIKKENIGLIEVMGLAVLPGRLQKELGLIEEILIGTKEEAFSEAERASLEKHADWIREMKGAYGTVKSHQEAAAILKKEVGDIFCRVLEDAGVYKNNQEGRDAFDRFMKSVGFAKI